MLVYLVVSANPTSKLAWNVKKQHMNIQDHRNHWLLTTLCKLQQSEKNIKPSAGV